MRIAVCLDYQAPFDLLREVAVIGKALVQKGHSVGYVVGDLIELSEYLEPQKGPNLFQAPVRRPAPHLVMMRPPVDGMADAMAVMGFDDRPSLLTLASAWYRTLKDFNPDAIIGLYAPLVWLVGPLLAPTFAIGSGAALPPVIDGSFPRLSADSSPIAEDAQMAENANAFLKEFGVKPIIALADIVNRCTPVLYGVPSFDPYLSLRRVVSAGLLGEVPNPIVPPASERLVAFLDVYCPGVETIVLALAGFELPVDVYLSSSTAGMRNFLQQHPHIKVWKDHSALLKYAENASVVLHHGVQDVAQRAMSLGRPQLIVPWTAEQKLLVGVISWMGSSWGKDPQTSIDDWRGTFHAILRDAALTVSAQHHARQLAKSMLPDAVPIIVQQLEDGTKHLRSN